MAAVGRDCMVTGLIFMPGRTKRCKACARSIRLSTPLSWSRESLRSTISRHRLTSCSSGRQDLARIHDVVRVEGEFDGMHELDARSMFLAHVFDLAVTHAVLPTRCAAGLDCAIDHALS